MKMFKHLKLADFFTLANLTCGFMSILYSFSESFMGAALFLLAAMVFDYLDGFVARKRKEANIFGKELDSLCDLVSFGVAPAVFGYALGLDSLFAIIVLIAFVCAGALRLCRFNVTKIEGYEGVPITFNALVFPLLYFVSLFFPIPLVVYLLGYLLMTFLMVSTFKIKKL